MHTPEGRPLGRSASDFLASLGVSERASVRDHLRDNYGLWHPPANYAALRWLNSQRHHLNRPTLKPL